MTSRAELLQRASRLVRLAPLTAPNVVRFKPARAASPASAANLQQESEPSPGPTLEAALEAAVNGRWRDMRSCRTNWSQGRQVIAFLHGIGRRYVSEVTTSDLEQARDAWRAAGYAPNSIRRRLTVLSVMGTPRVSAPKSHVRQWFLREEDEARLDDCYGLRPLVRLFIRWTCATGLRVEESLRLRWRDTFLGAGRPFIHVPGTKTRGADATLPLSVEAAKVLADIRASCRATEVPYGPRGGWLRVGVTRGDAPVDAVFPISYSLLCKEWLIAREFLGVSDVPTATLKALRRSFARRAHLNGMPADVLRQYLRHSDLQTTQRYLHLVGGYSDDEIRRWL